MNIKEHIEAGHYEKDENGRAVLLMRNGKTAYIYTTKHGGKIAGATRNDLYENGLMLCSWSNDGRDCSGNGHEYDLMPPKPIKVRVSRWGGMWGENFKYVASVTYDTREEAVAAFGRQRVIELTGEYEEPWK